MSLPLTSVIETHTAVVFFVGDRAYKVKKPVSFGFVDFTSRESRQAACHREVELNRRLAPDVYLGVSDVTAPDGELCEHLVVMRRLPATRRLATLVDLGSPVDDHLQRLARLLAAFHARADRSTEIDHEASAAAMLARWEANAAEMSHLVDSLFDPEITSRVHHLARRYLGGRHALFAARIAASRACDGHGDLLADDIFCLDEGPEVLDCLEFDDRLRYGDNLGDVASLAMDLERLGHGDLAATFLSHYRRFAADSWPTSLEHHHIAYRAHVRALVAGLRTDQGDPNAAPMARQLLTLATDHLEAGRVRLVVVGGLPGTGKSTVADRIAQALNAVVLRSDELRKQLAGLDPGVRTVAPWGEGLYRPETTKATYTELLRRARTCLSHGESVVLDATFSQPEWRAAARALADQTVADLDELHCTAPIALIESRIAQREARGDDASDATASIARDFAQREVPWPSRDRP